MTLIMGRWEAWDGSRVGPGLEKKLDPKFLWELAMG